MRRVVSLLRTSSLVFAAMLISGATPASAAWAGGDSSHELYTARTLPTSHYNLHVVRPSSLGLTDRIQVSSHLLMDLAGSPNVKLTWSIWQRPWAAAGIELGTGAHSGALNPMTFQPFSGDPEVKPYFLIGGIGTRDLGRRVSLTAQLRYAYHGSGFDLGDAEPAEGFHQFMPGASILVRFSPADTLWLETQASITSDHVAGGVSPFGFPERGARGTAGLWYAHAFDHVRVMAGVVKPPAPLPGFAKDWPVLPAIDLWWDLMRS
jgi:hypothetical protein